MKLIIIMTKLLSLLANTPSVMSGCVNSTDKYYIEFLNDFNLKKLDFGSLAGDKSNYSKDFSRVFNDYRRASILSLKEKTVG